MSRGHSGKRVARKLCLDVEYDLPADVADTKVTGQFERQFPAGGTRSRLALDRGCLEGGVGIFVEARAIVSNLVNVVVSLLLVARQRIQPDRERIPSGQGCARLLRIELKLPLD